MGKGRMGSRPRIFFSEWEEKNLVDHKILEWEEFGLISKNLLERNLKTQGEESAHQIENKQREIDSTRTKQSPPTLFRLSSVRNDSPIVTQPFAFTY
jgi:hypothetical protein